MTDKQISLRDIRNFVRSQKNGGISIVDRICCYYSYTNGMGLNVCGGCFKAIGTYPCMIGFGVLQWLK